ncbi:hypothetical protein JMUB3935_2325 [Leptotrichia trevisanii]|uniref:Uncharacterized protein n=1 Tax=Leptotrichia trevisanii TaxID=109328 RepID=A0A510KNM2_9FUSO|nr:hypothetical protein [Leptotrichia trevisanii]BBM53338.1 hypothetical protein JMUB3935_2325 [Leptotrichia trevisanii]
MTTVIFIYLIATMENIAKPVATSAEDFKENPTMFYPDWDSETMKYSTVLLQNPVIDSETGELREMTEFEKVKAGKRVLEDGSYLDEANKTIVTVAKPNEYSKWDKNTNTWVEDKAEKLQYLKDTRYKKQQEYIKFKKELENKEEEKEEFESLGFDITETEERITEIKSEMDLLKTEIAKLTKEIKKVEKEVA